MEQNIKCVLLLYCLVASSVSIARECDDVTKKIIEYRDALFSDDGYYRDFSDVTRQTIMAFGIDVSNDEDIEKFVCELAASSLPPPQTIPDLVNSLVEGGLYFHQEESYKTHELKTAAYYLWGKAVLEWAVIVTTREFEGTRNTISLYDQLGFPDFPLALSEAEIDSIVRSFPEEFLGNTFYGIVQYDFGPDGNSEVSYDVPRLVTAFATAQSFEDFAESLENTCPQAECFPRPDPALLQQYTGRKRLLNDVIDEFKSAGLWNLKRGDQPLECPDVIDDIVEALQLAKAHYGDNFEQALDTFGLQGIAQRPQKLKKWICQIVESKSQSEFLSLIPRTPRHGVFEDYYEHLSFYGMQPLLYPGPVLEMISTKLNQAEALERIGYPNFPLNVSWNDAKKVAKILENSDTAYQEKLTETFATAASRSDAEQMMEPWLLEMYESYVETLGTKEKRARFEHLSLLRFRILARLEEGGIFMLPE